MPDIFIPDVSEFQGTINWAGLGTDIAIVRINYGNSKVDSFADRNIDGARARCKVIGWYCYLIGGQDPIVQADVFCRVLQAHGGLRPNEFVVCDDEEGPGDQSGRINAFLNECDRILKIPNPAGQDWWYSGLFFSINHNLAAAKGHRWVAAYGQGEPGALHDLWQFTDAGSMAGIPGLVDMSVFHGSTDDFIRLIGGVASSGAGPSGILGAPTGETMIGHSYRPGGLGTLAAPSGWRLDTAYISGDGSGNFIHHFSNSGAGNDNTGQENLGGIFDPRFGAGCTWDDRGSAITFFGVGANGHIYRLVIWGLDGAQRTGWFEVTAGEAALAPAVPVAVGPKGDAGPPGPSYDDTTIKGDVATIESKLAAIKATL